MLRKILIVLIVLLLAAAGYAVYFLNTSRQLALPNQSDFGTSLETNSAPVKLIEPTQPDAPEPALSVLTTEPVVDYWVNQLDGQVYYVTTEGAVKRADRAGNPTTMSSSRFNGGVRSITASARGDAVIIRGGTLSKPEFKVFDVEKSIWRALPAGTTAAAWSPVSPSTEIAFLSEGKSLNVYTMLKGTSRRVLDFAYQDLQLDWPLPNSIILSEPPARELTGSVWLFDTKLKTIKTLISKQRGLWSQWQPSGGIVFSVDGGLQLFPYQGTATNLPFFTVPSKCFREGLKLYCAVPYAGLNKKQVPDNYLQQAAMSTDNIVSLSLAELPHTGEPSLVLSGEKEGITIDAWHLVKAGPKLYFVNRYNQQVYSLKILTD